MKTNTEIRAIGKAKFTSLYWPCVGADFLISLVIGAISGFTSVVPYASVASLILLPVLTIGLNFFSVQLILGETPNIGTPFSAAFDNNFGRKLGGYLWMELFTFLWSLLLVVPGIIKAFSYAMTPYILADCPNVRARDAIKLSMRIMKGKKWTLFSFYLGYIGWAILSLLTLGLLSVFYVAPYVNASAACWYLEAREDALRNGVITLGQLDGTEPIE